MSIVEQFASDRKARLVRLGAGPLVPSAPKKVAPSKPLVDPAEPFYPQMWFYDLVTQPSRELRTTLMRIRRAVCRYFCVTGEDIDCRRRYKELDRVRQIAFYLAAEHTRMTYTQIGRAFGDRDHSTAIHGYRKMVRRLQDDERLARDIANLEAML